MNGSDVAATLLAVAVVAWVVAGDVAAWVDTEGNEEPLLTVELPDPSCEDLVLFSEGLI